MSDKITGYTKSRRESAERSLHRFIYQQRDRLKRQRRSIKAELEKTTDGKKLVELNDMLTRNSEERAELENGWKHSTVRAGEARHKAGLTENTEQELICQTVSK